jgi:hypothetical protein
MDHNAKLLCTKTLQAISAIRAHLPEDLLKNYRNNFKIKVNNNNNNKNNTSLLPPVSRVWSIDKKNVEMLNKSVELFGFLEPIRNK